MDVSLIRAKLGIGPEAGVAWFSLDEADVGFAPQKSPGHRAVIVRAWRATDPMTYVFARSRTSRRGWDHDPHNHASEYARCWLHEKAKIVTTWPLTVKTQLLNDESSMCPEPDEAATAAVLAAPVPGGR
jgi:hypothetical protein